MPESGSFEAICFFFAFDGARVFYGWVLIGLPGPPCFVFVFDLSRTKTMTCDGGAF